LGRAHLEAGRPDEAIAQMQMARQLAERVSDPWMAVECLDWEAGALYLKEDPKALALAEEALRACRVLEPRMPRTEARILEHLGSIHVRNQNVDAAITYYEEAVEAAGMVRDLARVARTYHGMSIAYRQRGHLDRAAEFAHKALSLYSIEQDQTLVGRAENELGLLLMQQGQLDSAEKWFQSALGHFQDSHTERVRSHVLLSLAELYLARGDSQAAEEFTEQGLDLAERFDESLARATGYLLRARVFALRNDWQRSDAQFEVALALLAKLGLQERLAAAHGEYAQTFEQRGDDRGAAQHWRRAAQLALPRLSTQVTA